MPDFATLQNIVLEAKRKLSPAVWGYLVGGSESETTLLRNRQALDSIGFRPRVLRDVSEIDTSTTLLGEKLSIPVVMAPIGSIARFDRDGALAVAKAAERGGVASLVSVVADPSPETVAAETDCPLILALVARGDRDWIDRMVDQAKESGYRAIAIVTEAAYYGRRERDLINRLRTKGSRFVTYASLQKRVREERAGRPDATPSKEGLTTAQLDWDMVDRIKQRAGLPIMLKGINTAEDAKIAVEHGIDAIYISNHGGRQLDHGRATVDVLPEVVAAVGDKAEVIVDGGFVRATDMLKAIALGARAVAMGRMQCYALAAGGEAGVVRMLELLEEELIITMGLLGVRGLDELDPSYVQAVAPVVPAHPLSPFPVVMERSRS